MIYQSEPDVLMEENLVQRVMVLAPERVAFHRLAGSQDSVEGRVTEADQGWMEAWVKTGATPLKISQNPEMVEEAGLLLVLFVLLLITDLMAVGSWAGLRKKNLRRKGSV